MTNDGNPNPETEPVDEARQPHPIRSRLILLVAVIALIGAAIFAVQLFGILYAIIFPPDVPLPDDASELIHENFAYGSDRWVYGTSTDGCFLAEFYVEDGARCTVAPGLCGSNGFDPVSASSQRVASCIKTEQFSIFEMRYETNITTGYAAEPITRFEVIRDIFWTGPAPEATESPE